MRKYSNNSTDDPNRLNPNFISKAKAKAKANPNPNLNPNPNPSRRFHDPPSSTPCVWQSQEPSPMKAPPVAASDDARLPYRKSLAFDNQSEYAHCEYMTFDLSSLSRGELKQLKRRLISDLEQVRRVRDWVETGDFLSRPPELVTDHRPAVAATSSRESNQNSRPCELVNDKKKKLAPHSGSKKVPKKNRGLPLSSTGRDAKMPAMLSNSHFDKATKSCTQMLSSLMKHKFGWIFNTPVDVVALGLNDYHKIIKHPMDLGTVKSRLDNNEYRSPLDFASDVKLTFNNAMTYNPKGHDVYVMADALLAIFDKSFTSTYEDNENENQKVVGLQQVNSKRKSSLASPRVPQTSLNTPLGQIQNSTRPVPLPASPPNSVAPPLSSLKSAPLPPSPPKPVAVPKSAKLPKPKAKDPNKRQMTLEEKAKMGESLQQLAEEKMGQLVQLVRKRNHHLMQEGDEIELDLDILDTETLWELDRFVAYHKKAMSKMMRQGLLNNLQADAKKSPVSEVAMQKSKKGDFAEEDVDIGGDSSIKNFPPVEIEKDTAGARDHSSSSSGSSSSSDSSSSSNSDSGSSSGSDSDDSVQSPSVDPKDADPKCPPMP